MADSSCISTFRKKIPQSVRFVVSSSTGSFVFYLLNEAILQNVSIPWQPITVAYFVSYAISIFVQYFLHASLVYGYQASFWAGVASTYAGYTGALFASIPLNAFLVSSLGFDATQAWAGTLLLTGMANYFVLNALLGGEKSERTPREKKK